MLQLQYFEYCDFNTQHCLQQKMSSELEALGSPAKFGLQKHFKICVSPEDTLPSTTDAEELLRNL